MKGKQNSLGQEMIPIVIESEQKEIKKIESSLFVFIGAEFHKKESFDEDIGLSPPFPETFCNFLIDNFG